MQLMQRSSTNSTKKLSSVPFFALGPAVALTTPSLYPKGYRVSAQMPYELAYLGSKLECAGSRSPFWAIRDKILLYTSRRQDNGVDRARFFIDLLRAAQSFFYRPMLRAGVTSPYELSISLAIFENERCRYENFQPQTFRYHPSSTGSACALSR